MFPLVYAELQQHSTPQRSKLTGSIVASVDFSPIVFNPERRSTMVLSPKDIATAILNNEQQHRRSVSPTPISAAAAAAASVTFHQPMLENEAASVAAVKIPPAYDDDVVDEDDDLSSPVLIRESTFVQNGDSNLMYDKERQSLQNFEEFEKSLSTLKNDEDFAIMFNTLTATTTTTTMEQPQSYRNHNNSNTPTYHHHSQSPLSSRGGGKMRQSLDNIKKRHSLLNMEKQQQDAAARNSIVIDSNKLLDSMGASTSSSSSSSRLLRRSRLFDDINPMEHSSELNVTQPPQSVVAATESEPQHSEQQLDHTGAAAETADIDVNNRDRFKTIRISRKPPENGAPNLHEVFAAAPTATTVSAVIDEGGEQNATAATTNSAAGSNMTTFARIDTNSPCRDSSRSQSPQTTSRRQLVRPRAISGLMKRDYSVKSSSVDSLTNRTSRISAATTSGPLQNATPKSSTIVSGATATAGSGGLRNGMGSKSKSIHNLARPNTTAAAATKAQQNVEIQEVFKVPSSVAVNQRHTIARKTGLIRPSSGYYSYNMKQRNDSDTESGRMSPSSVSKFC